MDKRLIRINELRALLGGIDRRTIYTLEKLHNFPKRIKLSARNNAWRLNEVEQWLNARQSW